MEVGRVEGMEGGGDGGVQGGGEEGRWRGRGGGGRSKWSRLDGSAGAGHGVVGVDFYEVALDEEIGRQWTPPPVPAGPHERGRRGMVRGLRLSQSWTGEGRQERAVRPTRGEEGGAGAVC